MKARYYSLARALLVRSPAQSLADPCARSSAPFTYVLTATGCIGGSLRRLHAKAVRRWLRIPTL